MMTTASRTTADWVGAVQAEYRDMPGLRLTKAQVRRLWGLDDPMCDNVLRQLLAAHFLRRTSRDLYAIDASA